MISCDAVCYIAGALALLLLPLKWILSAAVAALVHECGHLLAVYLCGGKLRKVCIKITGCIMETESMGRRKSILCILAGPLASFSLLLLREELPLMAVCGFLQGAYNMLPVLPLDGGKSLLILLSGCCPEKEGRIMELLECFTAATVLFLGIWLFLRRRAGASLFICGVIFNIRLVRRKIPCKDHRIGLQWY